MDMSAEAQRLLVPIPEGCKILGGIGPTTMYELIKRGEVTKVNIGRRGFLTATSLARYVERLTGVCTPKADAELVAGGR